MRRLPIRRRLGAILLAVALLPFGASTASAKMPYVSVEIESAAPRADEPITIVARTWSDVDHTALADWGVEDLLDGLFVVRPKGKPGPDIAVDLAETAAGRFEGTISLPAGEWELVAFPDRTGWGMTTVPEGYPDRNALSVRAPGLDLTAVFGDITVALGALVATIASLAAGFAARP